VIPREGVESELFKYLPQPARRDLFVIPREGVESNDVYRWDLRNPPVIPREGVESDQRHVILPSLHEYVVIPREGVERPQTEPAYPAKGDPERGS